MTRTHAAVPRTDGPEPQVGVGLVVPYDMALDRELWRWMPSDVSLFFTRTPYLPLLVTLEMVEHLGDADLIGRCVAELLHPAPEVCAYACTSGSFVHGRAGERELTAAMRAAGIPSALTTSGALLAALTALGARTVAVATPYDADISARLSSFLDEAGFAVRGESRLDLESDIWKVPYARTAALVLDADHDDADVVVVSCTNLPTYDVIAPLEEMLGKPVVSANQATAWACLDAVGHRLVGPDQRLAQTPDP